MYYIIIWKINSNISRVGRFWMMYLEGFNFSYSLLNPDLKSCTNIVYHSTDYMSRLQTTEFIPPIIDELEKLLLQISLAILPVRQTYFSKQ